MQPLIHTSLGAKAAAHLPGQSRSEPVEQQLRLAIAQGLWAAGARLPTELELAARFGVSRATVREAFTRLRADGLVQSKPGRGSVVCTAASSVLRLPTLPGDEACAQLFELRRLLEPEAAALAATRRSTAALAALERAHADMAEAAASGRHAPEADLAFHRAVAQATGNPMLLSLLDFVGARLEHLIAKAWSHSARTVGGAQPAQAEHAAVLHAIRAGDAVAARAAAAAHLQASQQRLSPSGQAPPGAARGPH